MKIQKVWEDFLTIIKEEAGSRVVDTWFKAVSLCHWDMITQTATLEVPNQFVLDWIKNNYALLIQTHLSRLLHVDNLKLIFFLQGSKNNSLQELSTSFIVAPAMVVKREITSHLENQITPVRPRGTLNETHTFANFVVGPSNSLAYAAAQAVAEKPGILYNPLFFYGGSGLGKTHLLHAIGNATKKLYPKSVI